MDIIHANGSRCMFFAGVAGRLAGRPVVWHVRVGAGDGLWDRVLGFLATTIIVNSRAVGGRFPSRQLAAKVRMVHNGENLSNFVLPAESTVAAYRREFGVDGGQLLAMVARLTPEKDYETYFRAAAALVGEGLDARFLVVGSDPDPGQSHLRHLQDLASELGIDQHVVFTGNRDDVTLIMGCLDLLVHCAHIEGFGRVLVEGMAAGVAVVATAVGGIPEVVVDGETGILVPQGDHTAVAAAVGELLHDPQQRLRMGAAGRTRVEEKFSLDAHVDQVKQVYGELTVP